MYGSDTRAQKLNVQLGKTLGIFDAVVHSLVIPPRFKVPLRHLSNKIGFKEPKKSFHV